jgi:predicted RNase H-like nuclease
VREQLGKDDFFKNKQAGAYPSNRQRLADKDGQIRGEVLVKGLEAINVQHLAKIQPKKPTRQIFEVYPHPAMVALFKLPRTLKYKSRPHRKPEERLSEFDKYVNHLRSLNKAAPPANLTDFIEEYHTFTGKRLKNFEDRLDAIFCAYIALYYWWWGDKKCHIFGDMEKGYIVTPYPGGSDDHT